MGQALFWLYLVNAVLLINHEIDSAYWKEWELFKLPGGITGFLLLHIPVLAFGLYGLVLVYRQTVAGLVCSAVLSVAGLFAFSIHTYFIRRGREEFNTPTSLAVLVGTLVVSLVQLTLTIWVFVHGWQRTIHLT